MHTQAILLPYRETALTSLVYGRIRTVSYYAGIPGQLRACVDSVLHALSRACVRVCLYRKRTYFRGHNISWVKISRGLIFVGKSSPP